MLETDHLEFTIKEFYNPRPAEMYLSCAPQISWKQTHSNRSISETLLSQVEGESFCLQNRSQPGVCFVSGKELSSQHTPCLFPYSLLPLVHRLLENPLHLRRKASAFFF